MSKNPELVKAIAEKQDRQDYKNAEEVDTDEMPDADKVLDGKSALSKLKITMKANAALEGPMNMGIIGLVSQLDEQKKDAAAHAPRQVSFVPGVSVASADTSNVVDDTKGKSTTRS